MLPPREAIRDASPPPLPPPLPPRRDTLPSYHSLGHALATSTQSLANLTAHTIAKPLASLEKLGGIGVGGASLPRLNPTTQHSALLMRRNSAMDKPTGNKEKVPSVPHRQRQISQPANGTPARYVSILKIESCMKILLCFLL